MRRSHKKSEREGLGDSRDEQLDIIEDEQEHGALGDGPGDDDDDQMDVDYDHSLEDPNSKAIRKGKKSGR
jgi:hypothetical protein